MSKPTKTKPAEPDPYHTGPPEVGSEWGNEREDRKVTAILPARGANAYMVAYRVARGWPRQWLGNLLCSGTEWAQFVRNGKRRIQTNQE